VAVHPDRTRRLQYGLPGCNGAVFGSGMHHPGGFPGLWVCRGVQGLSAALKAPRRKLVATHPGSSRRTCGHKDFAAGAQQLSRASGLARPDGNYGDARAWWMLRPSRAETPGWSVQAGNTPLAGGSKARVRFPAPGAPCCGGPSGFESQESQA
jgi:hypothetical protein